MGIFDLAKEDSKRFTKQVPLTFYRIVEEEEVSVDVEGMFTNHHLGIDPDTRTLVNSKNIQCTVHEANLIDAGFMTRNASGFIKLLDCFVKATRSDGVLKEYKVTETYPDETLGIIVCTLAEIE